MDSQRPGCPFRMDPTAADIHNENRQLRALGPAALVELPGGIHAWSVTDPALAKRLMTSPLISKDARKHWPPYRNGLPDDAVWKIFLEVENALTATGEEHRRLRRYLGPAFATPQIKAIIPSVEAVIRQTVDDLASLPNDQPVDLRARFAWPIPLSSVNIMLGVPARLHDGFRSSVSGLFDTGQSPEQQQACQETVYGLIDELIAHKRQSPGDDMTTALVTARDSETGERLSETELRDSLNLLIGASHETTVNAFAYAIYLLARHRDQLALIQSGEVSWHDAVEEVLRHQAPIATIPMRFPVEEFTDVATGITFYVGDGILINFAAVGRAPSLHGATADDFDITRSTRRLHIAFGHGTHLCLGKELARAELRLGLAALFERFPDLELAEPNTPLATLDSFISNGLRQLPVLLHSPAASETAAAAA